MEWLYQWETAAVQPQFSAELLKSRPAVSPDLQLIVTHTRQEEGLLPTAFALKSDHPIVIDAACSPWLAVVLGACNGASTGLEIYQEMKEHEVIEPNMTPEQFAGVLRLLGSNGVLHFEQLPLPN